MAEALLSHEPRTLQEFGTLRESSTLQDISLAEGGDVMVTEVQERKEELVTNLKDTDHEANNEHKLKSNSLKRFFRLPSKKKGTDEADPDNCPKELAAGDVNYKTKLEKHNPTFSGGDGLHDLEVNMCESKAEHKRSKFCFGRMQSNSMHSEHSQRDLSGSFSRSNFRASISSYWHTVFKLKKNKKLNGNESDQDKASDLNDNSPENKEEESEDIVLENEKYPSVVDNILTEEIHALKISDGNDNN